MAAGVDHLVHETGKTIDQSGVEIDKSLTQPAAAGIAHAAHEAGKAIDQSGVEIDKTVFQPVGRGWNHFWDEWKIIGKVKEAVHEVIADADGRAKTRIDQTGDVVGTLEQKALKDVSALIYSAMFRLFLALAGAGTLVVLAYRITHRRLRSA